MAKRLLILGASRFYLRTIERLKSLGYFVCVIDMNSDSPGFAAADAYATIDITDSAGALEYAKNMAVDGVLAINDFGIETLAHINSELDFSGIRTETAQIAVNKAKMRDAWQHSGAPIPGYFFCDTLKEAESQLGALRFPLIVKPADSHGGGSRGIKVVFTKSEFSEAFEYAQSFYDDKTVVVEECVKGSEHSIEVIVKNGTAYILAVSEKVKTPYPYRVDKQVIYPARLDSDQMTELKQAVQQAVDGVGISDGVAHVELAMTELGPILFELGARPGGGATPQLVEMTTGINYLHLITKIATGEPIRDDELRSSINNKVAIYHFFTFEPCEQETRFIQGMAFMAKHKHIVDFEIFLKPGERVAEVKTGKDRHGFAVIYADSLEQAQATARQLDQKVHGTF